MRKLIITLLSICIATSGFTCSKSVKNMEDNYSLIAYQGVSGSIVSYSNTKSGCQELKAKLEEKNPLIVYQCK